MFAQVLVAPAPFWAGWGLTHFLIAIVIVAALIALVLIALRQFGIAIPEWVKQVGWVIIVAVVVVMAIKIVAGLW